jgi:hypothetical protein
MDEGIKAYMESIVQEKAGRTNAGRRARGEEQWLAV